MAKTAIVIPFAKPRSGRASPVSVKPSRSSLTLQIGTSRLRVDLHSTIRPLAPAPGFEAKRASVIPIRAALDLEVARSKQSCLSGRDPPRPPVPEP